MRYHFHQILFIFISCFVNFSQSTLFNGFEIRDLYTNDATFLTDSDEWAATALRNGDIYSVCGGTYLMGGYDVLGHPGFPGGVQGYYFERVYNDLPDHNIIYYTINLWLLDSWDSIPADYFQLGFDSSVVEGWGVGIEYFEVNSCGQNWPDLANMKIFGQVSHSGSSLTLRVISQLDSFGEDESLGFRDVHLIFAESPEMNVNKLCGLSSIPLPTNQCNCSYGEYFDEIYTFSCVGCNLGCRSCFGGTKNQCYECEAGYSFVDGECIKCDESCAECSGPNANQCIDCLVGMSLFNDGICVSECLNTQIYGTVLVCDEPCATGQSYFYENQTCSVDCNLPWTIETLASGVQICVSPCDAEGGFLYWDGTCNSLCPLPLQGRNNGTSNCLHNCGLDEYLFWDGSCGGTCESPLTPNTYKNRQFCQSPCPNSSDYIYWNETCGSTCETPLQSYNDGKAKYCIPTCSEGTFFHWDGFSCLASCDLPFRAREEDGILFCDYPCHRSEYLYWDGTCHAACPEPYHIYSLGHGKRFCSYLCEQYGDYFYPREGECLPDCNAPYIPRVQVIDDQTWYAVCIDPAFKGQIGGDIDDGDSHSNDPFYFTITAIKEVSEQVAGIFIVLDIVISLLRDSHVMILILVIKVLNFVRYIDIRIPPQLVQDFDSYDQNHFYLNFGPDMGEAVKDQFTKTPLPMVFERAGLHSRFLVNLFKPMTSLLIMLGFMTVIVILQRILRRKASNQFVLVKMIVKRFEIFFKWNLIVLLVVCNIDEVTLFGIIEWKTVSLGSGQDIISFLISIGMSGVALCVLIVPFYFLSKIYNTRFKVLSNQANEPYFNLLKKIEGFQLLWKDFKDSGVQKAFLPLYIFRIALIYMIIGLLYERPLLQMVLIFLMSGGMLIFMGTVKPFMKRLDFIQSIMYEIFMMIGIGSTLILAILDRTHAEADQLWIFLGDCILFCNIWICLTAVIFFVYRFCIEVQGVWKFYKTVPKPVSWKEFAILFLKDDDPIIQELKKNKRTSKRLDLTSLEREIEKRNFDRYHIKLISPETPTSLSESNNDEAKQPSEIPRKGELRIRRTLFGVKFPSSNSEISSFKTISTFDGEKSPSSLGSIENLNLKNKIRILNDMKKILQGIPNCPQSSDSEGVSINKKSEKASEDKTPKRKQFMWKDLETIKELDSMEASEIKNGVQTKRLENVMQGGLRGDLSLLSVITKRLSSETMMQKIEEVEIIKERVDLIKKKLTTTKEENGSQEGLFI